MAVAFVFPGQGSQYAGMGRVFFERAPEAKAVLDAADEALGEKLSKLILEGPDDELKLTRNTQPAILTVSIAMYEVLKKRGWKPDFLAGHSLGEYSALVASGALRFSDAVRAVRARGEFMQEAVPAGVGGMAAIVRLDPELVQACCKDASQGKVCAPANFNSPEQTVIAGHLEAIERAKAGAKASGGRALSLPVSAPFHCELMAPVKPRMLAFLEQLPLAKMAVPVVTNVEARPNCDETRIVSLLVEQITSPVRWVESVRAMVASGATRFVEVGPGKALTGLIKQIDKAVEAVAVDNLEETERILADDGAAG